MVRDAHSMAGQGETEMWMGANLKRMSLGMVENLCEGFANASDYQRAVTMSGGGHVHVLATGTDYFACYATSRYFPRPSLELEGPTPLLLVPGPGILAPPNNCKGQSPLHRVGLGL